LYWRADGRRAREPLQNIIAADGFDDFLFLAIVLIVVVVVAFGSGGMLIMGGGGVFVTGVLDMRHAVGIGRVFARMLGVQLRVVTFILMFILAMFGRRLGGDDRCCGRRVGLRFRDRRSLVAGAWSCSS